MKVQLVQCLALLRLGDRCRLDAKASHPQALWNPARRVDMVASSLISAYLVFNSAQHLHS